jgi:pimeloyl-ACP methyl ester carboxylesterase/DNA-binding CsgD family transcriptional regulator
MDAPPVQYVTTSDGFNLAYAVTGEGPPFVFLPFRGNHVQLNWGNRRRREWLEALSERFHVLLYDSRGQGMSSRGLPEGLSMDDFVLDLASVMDRAGFESAILLGHGMFGHAALRYAAAFPERVRALVIMGCGVSMTAWPTSLELLAEQNWDLFLRGQIIAYLPPDELHQEVERIRQFFTQKDYLTVSRAIMSSSVAEYLPRVAAPTLVLHAREFPFVSVDDAVELTAKIANARMVIVDGPPPFGETDANFKALDDFVRSLPLEVAPTSDTSFGLQTATRAAGLSGRELEVLRLVASGKSNQEIADELVISLHTVRRHLSNLFDKTGVHNRTQAAGLARDRGLL